MNKKDSEKYLIPITEKLTFGAGKYHKEEKRAMGKEIKIKVGYQPIFDEEIRTISPEGMWQGRKTLIRGVTCRMEGNALITGYDFYIIPEKKRLFIYPFRAPFSENSPVYKDQEASGLAFKYHADFAPIAKAIETHHLTEEENKVIDEFLGPWPLAEKLSPEALDFFGRLLKGILEKAGYIVSGISKYALVKGTTFAFPSHAVMFTLLAMFSGKPEQIPRKLLLNKPYSERSDDEKREADNFLSSILNPEEAKVIGWDDKTGAEIKEEKQIAIISDNPKVEAQAEISASLFSKDMAFREEALAIHIKRTFGAEGLRHLLGLIIGLEENFREGFFEWSLNEHLERLGYRKWTHGSYDPETKRDATAILQIFTSLFITARQKDGKGRERIEGEKLFSIDAFKIETLEKEIIDERLKIRATDFWYKNAFKPKDRQAPQYTKLLKKIAQENHRNHPLTIYLAPLFAIFWRMKPDQKLTVKSLMGWCDLDTKDAHKMRSIRDLEAELNYMKEAGYLGGWTNSGENPLPSNCKEPLDCVLTLTPPEWLRDEIKKIEGKRDFFLPPAKSTPPAPLIQRDELERLINNTGLTVNQFANHLGISRQMVSYIVHGKKGITQRVSDKIREVFGHILPV